MNRRLGIGSGIALLASVFAVAGPLPAHAAVSNWVSRAFPAGGLGAVTGDGQGHLVGFAADASGTGLQAYEYFPGSNTWTARASVQWGGELEAGYFSQEAATLLTKGHIMVMGGADEDCVSVNTVAEFNVASNTWTMLASLPTPRQQLAATTGPSGKIYAIGGYNGGDSGCSGAHTLTTVEAYSPRLNTWQEITPLNEGRFDLGAVTGSDGQIYALGGIPSVDTSVPLSTMEVYNPSHATNPWTVLPMPAPDRWSGVEGIDGLIYVNGVGAYNPSTATWSSFPASPAGPYLVSPGGSNCHGPLYGYGYVLPPKTPGWAMDRAYVKPVC
jgi:Kelch motif/Galactose oxidase, central domain